MPKKNKRKVTNLSRLMSYVLGNRPDEFGLVPDKEGYITVKELLKAINEEPNMAYVRESHLREVMLSDRDGTFEIDGKKIRSTKRSFCPVNRVKDLASTPKILFKGVKRKAYPYILKAGLSPGSKGYVVMTTDKDLAIRIACRSDQNPIILEIRAGTATKDGISFFPFGDSIYLAYRVRFPSHKRDQQDHKRRNKVKKRIGWKEEVKKGRRRKQAYPENSWQQAPF